MLSSTNPQGGFAPVAADAFAALLLPLALFADERPVAVAVSGGPDSMALAFCLKRFLAGRGRLLALIVEHGLREESAVEAQKVAQRLANMGMEAEILPWRHEAISSRLHVRAREARYTLLLEACRRHHINTLFLAHHADDQAETVLMRFAKGSGIDGLAGMAPARARDGIVLVRPFLSLPKERLIATCEANALPFVMDPSNEKEKYARGRLRRVMPLLAQEGFTAERLADLATRAREAREALDHYAKDLLRKESIFNEGGWLTVPREAFSFSPSAVRFKVLAACLRAIFPSPYPPERAALSALWEWIADGDGASARTLGGCLIRKGSGGRSVVFMREPHAAKESLSLDGADGAALWDGRWQVRWSHKAAGATLRALGVQQREHLKELCPDLCKRVPCGAARASLPALWRGEALLAIPTFGQPVHQQNHGFVWARAVPPDWLAPADKG